MKIINQYDQKKVDGLGRITVPIGLRKRLQIKSDSMVDVFTIVDDDGRFLTQPLNWKQTRVKRKPKQKKLDHKNKI